MMPLAEAKVLLALTGGVAAVLLLVLFSGVLPMRMRSSFARVWGLSTVVFCSLWVPAAIWRLPGGYCSTVRIALGSGAGPSQGEAFMRAEAERLTSPEVLRSVVAEGLAKELWGAPFKSLPLNENDGYEVLARAITVEPVGSPPALRLSVRGENRQVIAVVANRVADEYVRQAVTRTPLHQVKVEALARPPSLPISSVLARNAALGFGVSALCALITAGVWAGRRLARQDRLSLL